VEVAALTVTDPKPCAVTRRRTGSGPILEGWPPLPDRSSASPGSGS
jgi:hypothetical protein